MNNKIKNTWLSPCVAFFLAASGAPALAAGKITALNVNNDIATFTTEEVKTHAQLGCVTGDATAWAVSTTANDGLYPLLAIAQQMQQPLEMFQGSVCLSGIEKPEMIFINYQAADANKPVVSSLLNFVARSQITMAEGVSATVKFTLKDSFGGLIVKDATLSNEKYLADFGLLTAGDYTLTTSVSTGSGSEIEIVEEVIEFNVISFANRALQDSDGNLYIQLPQSYGSKLLKLSLVNGAWSISEITQEEWDSLVLSVSTFTFEPGEFSQDEFDDIRLFNTETSDETLIEYGATLALGDAEIIYIYDDFGRLKQVITK
ncbi:hypothetical protein [Thalassomonas sp. RHCl1]|uniref:hypothetical protein n=1 Tax=Thalassomonas sp. RHCl1 TaxID=2995320 RepID=UPI00248C7EB0|nr:hypothetical protein [Thalassomonas sp. RHCl1]